MAYTDDQEQLIVDNTVATNLLDIVGRGIDFPLRYNDVNVVGTLETSTAGKRINDSIHIILATRIGERPFNLEFGSRLPEMIFEPNDEMLQRLLVIYTYEALQRWERRIELSSVSLVINLDGDAAKIGVTIVYTIRNSHIRGSYVYPFVMGAMPTRELHTGQEAKGMNILGEVVW